MTKNNILNENSSFSEKGQQMLVNFQESLENFLNRDEIQEMSLAQLEIIKMCLDKMVQDTIDKKISARVKLAESLNKMTDEEFESYLKNKYGDVWPYLTLLPEELVRLKPISNQEIEETVKIGQQDYDSMRKANLMLNPFITPVKIGV